MPNEEKGDKAPNDGGKVTNRDLWLLTTATNARIDAQTARIDAQTGRMDAMMAHFDTSLGRLDTAIGGLRGIVNEQLHDFERRVDKLEQGYSLRNALLGGSWKITAALLGCAGLLGAVIARCGLPWEWGH
jgi:hypothetical protein